MTTLVQNVGPTLVQAIGVAAVQLQNVTTTNEKCSIIWNSLQTRINSEWWGKCDETCCRLGSKYELAYQKEQNCNFDISSENPNAYLNLDVDDNRYLLKLQDGNDTAQIESDFRNFVKANWEKENTHLSPVIDYPTGFYYETISTKDSGSFSFEMLNDNEANLHISQGETTISGKCQLGSNEILCSYPSDSFFSILSGNTVKAKYTITEEEDGKKIFQFNIDTVPNISIIPPTHLGLFQVSMDSENQIIVAKGDLNFFGKPLFLGDMEYKYANEPLSPVAAILKMKLEINGLGRFQTSTSWIPKT